MLLDPPRVDSDGFAVPAQVCRPASEPDQGIGTPRIVVIGLLRSRKTLFVGGAHLGGLRRSPERVAQQRNGLCAGWEFPQVRVAIVSGTADRRDAEDEDYGASHGVRSLRRRGGGGEGRKWPWLSYSPLGGSERVTVPTATAPACPDSQRARQSVHSIPVSTCPVASGASPSDAGCPPSAARRWGPPVARTGRTAGR